MSEKDCRFESTIEGSIVDTSLTPPTEPLTPLPVGGDPNDARLLVFEPKDGNAGLLCLTTSNNEMEASASTQAPNAGSYIEGTGGSRSSLYAYAPNNEDSGVTSFSGSFGQVKEINGGREREMSSVGDMSMRSALKQAKRERRQKAKEGDAEQAFAGSDAGDSCDDEGMKEIVVLPARGARRSSENAWAAPLVNLMNKEEVESPRPTADEKPRSKRDNLRRGKKQLMSGWCQDLDNQKRETQVMDWMADLGSAVPTSSFSIARSASQANTENQYSVESVMHYESSSSVVQGLREIVGSARAATATEVSRPSNHPSTDHRRVRSASFSDEVTTSMHIGNTGGGALPLAGFDFVGGESISKRVSHTAIEPHHSPIVGMYDENSTVLAMGAHEGEDVILTARRPTETEVEGGNAPYLLSPSHTTLPMFFGGHHLVAHCPPKAAETTETTTIAVVGGSEVSRAVRPRDAIDAIHKLRLSEDIYEERINPLNSDSSAASLFSGERSMESSYYLPESPQLFRDMNDSIHIANNRMVAKGECAVDFGFTYGDELASPPSETVTDTDKQPAEATPVIERLTHIGGIRTHPIPRPNRTTSTVSLNECAYNLHLWNVEELGWFVVPSDNIDDPMMAASEGISGESGSSSTNPQVRAMPTFCAPDDSRTDDDISMKNPLGEQVGASPVVGCRNDSFTNVPLSHQFPPPGPFPLNSGVPPLEVTCDGSGSVNLGGISPHLGASTSQRMPVVVGITKDSPTTIPPAMRAPCYTPSSGPHHASTSSVAQRVDPNEVSSRSVSAFGNAVIHNIPPSAGGAFRSSSTSLFPQQHLPAPTTPQLQRAPTPLHRGSSVANSSFAGCDTPMGRSSNIPYYGDLMRANSMSQPLQTPPPTSPRILSTPQGGNAVDILSAFFSTGQPGVSNGTTPQQQASNSMAFGTSSTSHSDRAGTPTSGPFHSSTSNQQDRGNQNQDGGVSGAGGGGGGGGRGDSMRYSLSSVQFGTSQFLGDADVDYSVSHRLNSINSLNVHKQQEQSRRLALAQFHMQFKSLLVQLQQPTVNRPPIRTGAPPKRWSGVITEETSGSDPIATLIPTFAAHSTTSHHGQGSASLSAPTAISPSFIEWSMSANALSPSKSRYAPLPYYADIIAHYKVTVDTLTHAATNHTLQLAHPLSGVNARSYRRSETRFKKDTSSTTSEATE